ncbi:hypothetical protein C7R95_22500 [Enterobacter hormaechei]|nr:hypothetical protein C7R95_22500 [Enterobacter hormaechei]
MGKEGVSLSKTSGLAAMGTCYVADSKKAPLGRFFTWLGRAGCEPVSSTHVPLRTILFVLY